MWEEFLKKEKLSLNGKSRIYTSNDNFIFLGRNQKGEYAHYRRIKRKMKNKKYLYEKGEISLMEYVSCKLGYKLLCMRYFGQNRPNGKKRKFVY